MNLAYIHEYIEHVYTQDKMAWVFFRMCLGLGVVIMHSQVHVNMCSFLHGLLSVTVLYRMSVLS